MEGEGPVTAGGTADRLRVELGPRSYDIVIGSGILGGLGEALRVLGPSPKLAVVSNPTVFALYGATVVESIRQAGYEPGVVTVPDGEEYKSVLWAEHVWGECLKLKLDRRSSIVALGGGVIGDLACFAASTYMRGIGCVQVPTTLLAQVDSSVGGKTGVNHELGKNMIGTFWQPSLVWADLDTLSTLGRRELMAGLAEVIKYGVIWDEGFFEYLKDKREEVLSMDAGVLVRLVRRSCEIKAEVVSRDEREGGLRAILNFGHTIGHAVETATGYGRYLHGEAVAIGMCEESRISVAKGLMGQAEAERVCGLVKLFGLPSEVPGDIGADVLIGAMELDKKAVAGSLRFTLPERVGKVRVNEPVERKHIEGVLAA